MCYFEEDDFDTDFDMDEPLDGFVTDLEADADALASMGWGTDEDYGYYGEDDCYEGDW